MKFIFIFAFFTALFHPKTKLCDCDGEVPPLKKTLLSASAVFTGTVISHKVASYKEEGDSFEEIRLKIDSTIKGDTIKNEITILTEHSDCGIFLTTGKQYLVFAFENNHKILVIHRCFAGCPELSTAFAKKELEEIYKLQSDTFSNQHQ